ncbi:MULTISPECIES: ABC transporter ATP-binding protein [unclassified Gluconobacter]|uniref:ABC transporter ATP-binding protein n=1 Tax=unclassified Gluconobacter TaxID=2644261 RepID=UPI001C0513FB|nr:MULTISPECIES: ABC transporter ATP-binding protein [unclassified Gluconobacter]
MVNSSAPEAPLGLTLSHVHHSYDLPSGSRLVLEDVSLDVAPGEFVALIGPSGCGKSTLLRLVAGLEAPDAGTLLADGVPIAGPDPSRIIMFQDPTLYPWRTVRGNIALGLDIRKEKDAEAIDAAIRLVGLEEFAAAWPHQLSGGMAQRVALARALINHPRLLILDEPLGKLDSLTRLAMQTELYRLWSSQGFTALMVTHDVEEALLLATRVIIFSPRPAQIIADIRIDGAQPRHRDDPSLQKLRADILLQLEAAML